MVGRGLLIVGGAWICVQVGTRVEHFSSLCCSKALTKITYAELSEDLKHLFDEVREF